MMTRSIVVDGGQAEGQCLLVSGECQQSSRRLMEGNSMTTLRVRLDPRRILERPARTGNGRRNFLNGSALAAM